VEILDNGGCLLSCPVFLIFQAACGIVNKLSSFSPAMVYLVPFTSGSQANHTKESATNHFFSLLTSDPSITSRILSHCAWISLLQPGHLFLSCCIGAKQCLSNIQVPTGKSLPEVEVATSDSHL